ncbi:MAG: hypothetical protein HY866_23900 [Chloroflexi bacterium]|nr:hypothetical protein [Chloroflexota bacterium]
MSKRKKPKRQYQLIAFKAFEDTDQDILDWWEGIEEGQRSDTIRELIREHLTGRSGRQHPLRKSDPRLDVLPVTELAKVRDDTTWIREALNDIPAYLERIVQQAVVLQPVARSPAEAASIQVDPALTAQDTARREARVRRTLW